MILTESQLAEIELTTADYNGVAIMDVKDWLRLMDSHRELQKRVAELEAGSSGPCEACAK